MPTYEYQCAACEHAFEKYQQITSRPLKKCPECKKRRLIRLIGAGSGVIFKGSGFYQNDYRSASYKQGEINSNGKGKGNEKETGKLTTPEVPKKPNSKNKQNKNS